MLHLMLTYLPKVLQYSWLGIRNGILPQKVL